MNNLLKVALVNIVSIMAALFFRDWIMKVVKRYKAEKSQERHMASLTEKRAIRALQKVANLEKKSAVE